MTSRRPATDEVVEHQIAVDGTVTIKTASWDLQLLAADDDRVRVRRAAGGRLPSGIQVERTDEGVTIRQPNRFGIGFVTGRDDTEVALEVQLPAGATVNVTTASGEIHAASLTGGQLYRTASGDVVLEGVDGTITTETVSGDVIVRVRESIELSAKTVSGDVLLDGGEVNRANVVTTSGDVRVRSRLGRGPHAIGTLSGDATIRSGDGLRVTARTVSGDLRSDLPHRSEGGPGRRAIVVGDGAVDVQFRSVSGDLRVIGDESGGEVLAIPVAPVAPTAPTAPTPPTPPTPQTDPALSLGQTDEREASRLAILRSLERGEIDISEATDRLADLDGSADD